VQDPEPGHRIEPEEATRPFRQDIGATTMLVNILGIIDDAKCYEIVRHLRWPDGVRCPHCDSDTVVKQGRDETESQRQRYECRSCGRRFDDLTDTIFAGHHRPLRVWVLVLYFMGLDLSNEQIASIPAIARPEGVVSSSASVIETKPAPRSVNSRSVGIRSATNRPQRSSRHRRPNATGAAHGRDPTGPGRSPMAIRW
jgi:transposase-like protein